MVDCCWQGNAPPSIHRRSFSRSSALALAQALWYFGPLEIEE